MKKEPLLPMNGAFLSAYDACAEAIFRHCYFRVLDRDRAKDIMQETFVRAWRYCAEGKTVENMRAFLYKIANNVIIDEARKQRTVSLDALAEEGFDPPAPHGASTAERAAELTRIRSYIRDIPSPYREVLVMRYVDDLSPKEIAAMTGETENTISVRIHRAMEKLRMRADNERPDTAKRDS